MIFILLRMMNPFTLKAKSAENDTEEIEPIRTDEEEHEMSVEDAGVSKKKKVGFRDRKVWI